MNKAELVNRMATAAGISQSEAQEALSAALGGIEAALANGDKVALAGFGNFNITERAARTGRNPATGASIQIPAKKVVKFKAGKALNEAVQ
ncbi:MAG: HU family DNA-binding protein [Acidobacteriota bacterium]